MHASKAETISTQSLNNNNNTSTFSSHVQPVPKFAASFSSLTSSPAPTTSTDNISSSSSMLNLPAAMENTTPSGLMGQQQQVAKSPFMSLHKETNNNAANASGNKQQPKGPICILQPCSNSHPFEERRILVTRSEESAVKIGRSVIRLQPLPNNAIFDCKVLSRNHAILWQNMEGQFLIKDTRSSNGTFINNERLSASGEESEPRELFSGDILQLGVEIVDNTKKVASGCVTCIVRLLNERGEECAGRTQNDHFTFPIRNDQQIPLNYTLVRNDKLFILDQYIKESKFRENVLGQKLQMLEGQLLSAQEALQAKWDEHIKQELLLSRIELLESQLAFVNAKKAGNSAGGDEELLRQEIHQLMEDRAKAEHEAKESLRAKFEQVQETSMRLHDAEMGLVNVEEECAYLRQRCADFEDQLNKQREDYDALLTKYDDVSAHLLAAEKAAIPAIVEKNAVEKSQQPILTNGALGEVHETSDTKAQNASNDGEEGVKWIEVLPENEPKESSKVVEEPQNEEQLPAAAAIPNPQVREMELKIAQMEAELERQHDRYNTLMEIHNDSEKRLKALQEGQKQGASSIDEQESGTTLKDSDTVQQTSSTNFQVFMLSVFPFILGFFMVFAPFFHLFGFTTKPAITTAVTDEKRTGEEQIGEPVQELTESEANNRE